MLEIKRNKTFCTFNFTITCKEFLLFTPQQKHRECPNLFQHTVIWKRAELGNAFLSLTEVNNSENKSQFLKLEVRCDLHLLVFNISRAGQLVSCEGTPRGNHGELLSLGVHLEPGAQGQLQHCWHRDPAPRKPRSCPSSGSGSKPSPCPSFPSLPNV